MIRPNTRAAYEFFHEATLGLAMIEHTGINIDTDYLDRMIAYSEERIRANDVSLKLGQVWSLWQKRFGQAANIDSETQLGTMLFDVLKLPSPGKTGKSNKYKTDVETLGRLGHPWVTAYLENKKLKKVLGTYLLGLRREVDENGRLHPSYNLTSGDDEGGGAVSFRGSCCIAKGTPIEVVRDIKKYPKGIPIEDVKAGDWVYCFTDDLKLTLRQVKWAGKTGHKKVIRIHWRSVTKTGYIDVTPEHPVRLATGEYVRADSLKPKDRVMAMSRNSDRIYPTSRRVRRKYFDHRFVYRKLVGKLHKGLHVHHKDGNHWNNVPTNLEAMTPGEHTRLHSTGKTNARWIHTEKFQLLRMLAGVSGKSALLKEQMDFNTFKQKAALHGIDLKKVKDRYDGNGRYVSKGRLKRLARKGVYFAKTELKVNLYKLWRMLDDRGIKPKRFPNAKAPPTSRVWNNHKIERIEVLDKSVDVYDLTIDQYPNFIANEVVVHNSDPNFQNIPIRNPEMSKLIRPCFIASPGRRLVEIDFSGIEVRVAACYNRDPMLVKYIKDKSTDMHRDMACEIFMLRPDQVGKKSTRDSSKNQFVFPQFYGSVYFQCAPPIWESMERRKFMVEGTNVTVRDWLKAKGITELGDCDPETIKRDGTEPGTFVHHLKEVENRFWNKRFKGYTEWKKRWYDAYLKAGEFYLYTGFTCSGVYKRNAVLNYAIQGSAFHCLLKTVLEVQKECRRRKLKAKFVGQIHDSMLADVPDAELQEFLNIVYDIATRKLAREWTWITVPMEVEVDVVPEGKSWLDKQAWVKHAGIWMPENDVPKPSLSA